MGHDSRQDGSEMPRQILNHVRLVRRNSFQPVPQLFRAVLRRSGKIRSDRGDTAIDVAVRADQEE